jgi:glycosyltransferase involved in cell wall biosynthesis
MLLSIITVNKNNAQGLEKTIQSVIGQTASNYEYIIIDGASGDGSVDIIEKYSEKINSWVSEPDTGIYNAMNKGIRKASGDYCLFLNSGDWLINPKTLKDIFTEIKGDGDIYYTDKKVFKGKTRKYPVTLSIYDLIMEPLNHQNTFIRRSLFQDHNYYNENLNISADWEFFLNEFWIHKSKFIYLSTNIAFFDTLGIGSRDIETRNKEDIIVFRNVFNNLAEPLIELRRYRGSIYADIINKWGNTRVLDFILAVYRFFIRRLTQ